MNTPIQGFAIPLGALSQQAADRTPKLAQMAQRMELTDRLRRYMVQHTFSPGDFVKQKKGLETMKDDRKMIFVRYLEPGLPDDDALVAGAANSPFNRVNCILGILIQDGASMVFVANDSQALEPDPDPDAEAAAQTTE